MMKKDSQTAASLEKTVIELNEKNCQLEIKLESALKKISWFEEQIKLMRGRTFGKRSEKADQLPLEVIFNANEGLTKGPEETEEEIEKTETITYTRRKFKGRLIDTSQLPRRQEIHDLTPEEKICCGCGSELHKIRDDISEQIEMIPRQLYVIEHVRPQYACRSCVTVKSAEKELSPIPKGMAGASLIADTVISKYEHHLPLYRQSKILDGLGINIPDNTLGNWVMQSGEGLQILDRALQSEIIQANYLQVDETPVKLLTPEKQAYMWVFHCPLPERKLIRFRFDLTRGGSVAEEELKAFKGLLQNDGYAGYNGLRQQKNMIAFGCMAHARRKFAEVAKIGGKNSQGKAGEAILYFAQLYAIEEEARKDDLDFLHRKSLRQKKATPILARFYEWLSHTKNQVPPESAIGKAIAYTLKQWPYLIRYIDYGEVEIDNNWVENQIRPFALGKKNWLFIKHEESAQIAALFYSLIQSAKLNALNPRVYLHYLLTQIHSLRRKQVNPADLLPHHIKRDVLDSFAQAEHQKALSAVIPLIATA